MWGLQRLPCRHTRLMPHVAHQRNMHYCRSWFAGSTKCCRMTQLTEYRNSLLLTDCFRKQSDFLSIYCDKSRKMFGSLANISSTWGELVHTLQPCAQSLCSLLVHQCSCRFMLEMSITPERGFRSRQHKLSQILLVVLRIHHSGTRSIEFPHTFHMSITNAGMQVLRPNVIISGVVSRRHMNSLMAFVKQDLKS